MDSIFEVKHMMCSTAFGHQARTEYTFEHPGYGTPTIRAPNFDRSFVSGDGVVQRRFDQSADMWALGVMGLRVITTDKSNQRLEWAEGLHSFSKIAEKQLKIAESPPASKRAACAQAALQDDRDRGSWIAKMVREKDKDSWLLLEGCMLGREKVAWMSLLNLLEGLLRYTSEHRLTADSALKHRFFSSPDTAP